MEHKFKTIKKINTKWECLVTDLTGLVKRGDRITVYTPKIGKIIQTFNKQNIEAIIMGTYLPSSNFSTFGNVVYLDRGRKDGVEVGTVFETYSFYDKGTGLRLTNDPTYKTGEITVISLTDNFATGLITNSSETIRLGALAITRTEEQVLLDQKIKRQKILSRVEELENQSLDELDISLNLNDISKDLLEKADKVQLTEDELAELERQEREQSKIEDHEKDLKELEILEKEILDVEKGLNKVRLDEDTFLEQQNLNQIESGGKEKDPNAFPSLNEIEAEVGLKYLDQNLNSKENPYGLTEFDLEEIDELLNTQQL